MTRGDLASVLEIADRIHPDLPEPPDVFANRLALWPAGALVLDGDRTLLGYAIGHPIRFPNLPALGCVLDRLCEDSDTFYVHDVALMPEARGRSRAGEALNMLHLGAPHLKRTCLVAVYGTTVFWARYGFEATANAVPREKLASYGDDATLMVREW
ncbi:acetyltransferase, GNAT family protein [Fulvimarina pelagi HTCC2506]|uniref:Acetyltransferase, GNAT family protein n=1 Tax=Fulvimarina pelagi HTCC2506 TaxID=314231 RepID=Q0G550_9HYPH|nr:hypothetical protein [Fulvimarina pelagi]EAU43214.1 acetyltransferase, GNAT family protein [Fulvimarina pelagi HTCC2506]